MEIESTHLSVDNSQHAVSQTVQRVVMDNMHGERTNSLQQQIACRTAKDAGQLCAAATSDIVAECEALCSKAAEADLPNQASGETLNVRDSQESRTTWQDDEYQYKTQMNLLKYDVKFFFS